MNIMAKVPVPMAARKLRLQATRLRRECADRQSKLVKYALIAAKRA
jgi:hypothetical protein